MLKKCNLLICQPLLLFVMSQRHVCISNTKNDEVRLAEEASKKYGSPAPTIFSRVIDKTIPADIIYEDDKVYTAHRRIHMRMFSLLYST